ncbi:alanine racemase [Oerskovia sp. M15]
MRRPHDAPDAVGPERAGRKLDCSRALPLPDSSPAATSIADRFAAVRARIDAAARAAGRRPEDVQLLVATKTQDAAAVREVIAAGATLVGENRVQELVAKAPDLADLVAGGRVRVHMIGHLQRNKVNQVLATATGVETVDSLALAEALASRSAREGRALDVMVQVNVSGEESKAGIRPDDAAPSPARSPSWRVFASRGS